MVNALFALCLLTVLYRGSQANETPDFPLENCMTDEVDLLLLDVRRDGSFHNPFTSEYTVQEEILITIAETFFVDGFINMNDSRVRLASVTADPIKGFYSNWDFTSTEPLERLMERKHKLQTTEMHFFIKERAPLHFEREMLKSVFSANGTFGSRSGASHVIILIAPVEDLTLEVRIIDTLIASNELNAKVYFVVLFSLKEDHMFKAYPVTNRDDFFRSLKVLKVNLILELPFYGMNDKENIFNKICRPCIGLNAFPVESGTGISCFKLGLAAWNQVQNYERKFRIPKDQCDYSEKLRKPLLMSFFKILNLEKEVFKMIYTNEDLASVTFNGTINIPVQINGAVLNRIVTNNFWARGEESPLQENQTLFRIDVFELSDDFDKLLWHFPGINSHLTLDSKNVLHEYESWKKRVGSSEVKLHRQNFAGITHCLYEYPQDRLLKRKFPSQPLLVQKPSNKSIDGALSRGNFYIIRNADYDDWKLESKYNIMLQLHNAQNSKAKQEKRGLVSGWEVPDEFDIPSDVPLFDCELGKWQELLPFILVCDGNVDCSNGRDESHCNYRMFIDHQAMVTRSFTKYRRENILDLSTIPCVKYKDPHVYFDSKCTTIQCPLGTVKCPMSYCIPLAFIEDGMDDCPNGEDEIIDFYQYTSFQNVPTEKLCSLLEEKKFQFEENKFLYILKDQTNTYCRHGEDKILTRRNINYNFQCRRNNLEEFRELGTILPPNKVCDGKVDCFHGDDEIDCYTCPPGLRCEAGTVTVADATQISAIGSLPPSKLVDLSGATITNFYYNFTFTIGQTVDLRFRNCNLTSSTFEKLNGEIFKQFFIFKNLDLSQNKLESLNHHSVWIMCASKLNLSGNLNLNLEFSQEYYIHYSIDKNEEYKCFQFLDSTHISFPYVLVLDLSFTNVGDDDLTRLDSFTNLEEIYLRNCPISDLKPGLPATLRVIDLRGIPLSLQENSFSNFTAVANLMVETFEMCCPQVLGGTITPDKCSHAVEEDISSCEQLIDNSILRYLLWIMGIFALLGNIIVIVYRCVLDKTTFKTTYGIFIFNLSVSDLVMGIYLMAVAVIGELFQGDYYKHHQEWRQGAFCKTIGLLSTLSSEISAFFILFITFDRFLAVKFPFRQIKVTKCMSVCMCGGAWIVGVAISLTPLLMPEWEIYSVSSICVGLPLTTDDYEGKIFSVFIFIILNFVIFILIALGQYSIFKAKADINEKSRNLSGAVAQRRYENDLAIARQLSLVVITDFLCWFPIGVMGLMALSGKEVSKDAYVLAAIFIVPINSAINPLLYTVPTLRKKWAETMAKCFKSEIQTNPSTDGTSIARNCKQNVIN